MSSHGSLFQEFILEQAPFAAGGNPKSNSRHHPSAQPPGQIAQMDTSKNW